MTTVFEGSPKFGGISGDHARVTAIEGRVLIRAIDAMAEGVEAREIVVMPDRGNAPETWWFGTDNGRATPKSAFRDLWDDLNAKRAPWASNPWVVAITFLPALGNIDGEGQ